VICHFKNYVILLDAQVQVPTLPKSALLQNCSGLRGEQNNSKLTYHEIIISCPPYEAIVRCPL